MPLSWLIYFYTDTKDVWFKQYLFRIKYMGIYTMSCETGSDIKHKAFVKVISCERYFERYFMYSLNHDSQADVIKAFNSTSQYFDDLLNIDNPYFEVNQFFPSELQLNKATTTDTDAPF